MKVGRMLHRPGFWVAGYGIWALVLLMLSSTSSLPGPNISNIDKLEHTLYFAAGHIALGIALFLAAPPRNRRQWMTIGAVIIGAAIVTGILDEWHQSFVPGRFGNDPGDIIADACGGIVAAALLRPAAKLLVSSRPLSGAGVAGKWKSHR